MKLSSFLFAGMSISYYLCTNQQLHKGKGKERAADFGSVLIHTFHLQS